jgi:hypothetical protein
MLAELPEHDHGQQAGARPRRIGIGDHDGMLEQVGSQDWQQAAMA